MAQEAQQRQRRGCMESWELGCGVMFALFVVGCIAWLLFGAWIYDQFNPPFVPPANAQQCGKINAFSSHDDTDAKQCFWVAYQACQTATLSVDFQGVDAYVLHNFVSENRSKRCVLTDYV